MNDFVTNWGRLDAPILERDQPPALGVYRDRADGFPIGVAFPVGWIPHRRGPAAPFRLAVEGVEPDARWICVGRRFVELGEAADEV